MRGKRTKEQQYAIDSLNVLDNQRKYLMKCSIIAIQIRLIKLIWADIKYFSFFLSVCICHTNEILKLQKCILLINFS